MMSTSLSAKESKENNSKTELTCLIEQACSVENGEFESEMYPTFAEGYADGLAEGKRLALIPDKQTYDSYWKSYRDYPSNHPTYTQNFEYFRGKYLGIVDGWLANYVPPSPSGGGWDLPDGNLCTDSNGLRRPCWAVALDNQE